MLAGPNGKGRYIFDIHLIFNEADTFLQKIMPYAAELDVKQSTAY